MSTHSGATRVWRLVRVGASAVVLAAAIVPGFSFGGQAPVRAALVVVPVPDTLTMKHDTTALVPAPGVLGNDVGILGTTTAILVSGPSHGSLTLHGDGGYTYVADPGYVGVDVFRYRPSGLVSSSTTDTITTTNASPVAIPDSYPDTAGVPLVVAARERFRRRRRHAHGGPRHGYRARFAWPLDHRRIHVYARGRVRRRRQLQLSSVGWSGLVLLRCCGPHRHGAAPDPDSHTNLAHSVRAASVAPDPECVTAASHPDDSDRDHAASEPGPVIEFPSNPERDLFGVRPREPNAIPRLRGSGGVCIGLAFGAQ